MVAETIGQPVDRVVRISGSVANQDFVVEYAGQPQLVLKAGPREEIAAETWACERLAAVGVPVPHVVASDLDLSRLGCAYLIARFVPGEPTSDVDVAREAGGWMRRVHEVELFGWGSLIIDSRAPRSSTAAGRFSSWREAVDADLAGLPELVEAGVMEKELADRAVEMVRPLHYDGAGFLLHNDLKPAHLFGQSGGPGQRLSSIIDWGDASVGDPAADVARLSMAGPAVTSAFLDGYGLTLTDGLIDRLARYRLLWNVRALTYELRAGGDWFDTYRDRISTDVGHLTGRRGR